MKRKWIIVEDDQAKLRAYVKAFLQLYAVQNLPFSDQVTFLVFRQDDEKEVNSLVGGNQSIASRLLSSSEAIASYINTAKEWPDGIIVLLDFLLHPLSMPVLQDKHNVVDNWRPIENRRGDDIICLLTSEYYGPDYIKHFANKGTLGVCDVMGDPDARTRKATDNILRAHQEWIDRYDHPGKKLLHALMLAQRIGNAPGHIERRSDIYPGFPFREALLGDDNCLPSFKALFYRAPSLDKAGDYACSKQTVVRVMLECGVGCEIVATGDKGGFVNLPLSPGALFLFRLCYLIRMLRDERYSNPVVKIELTSADDKIETKLHFKKPISALADAFASPDAEGQTVPLLRTFESCCIPITPSCDQALNKTFDVAALSVPSPVPSHIEAVRKMKPLPLGKKRIKVRFEDQAICFLSS